MGRSGERAGKEARLIYERATTEAADRFEAWLAERFREVGNVVVRYTTQRDQLAHGDMRIDGDDCEVKFDMKMHASGNVMIEVDERRTGDAFIPSGVCASSSARWYLVGDYSCVYMMERSEVRSFIVNRELVKIYARLPSGYRRHSGHGVLITRAEAATLAAGRVIQQRGITWNGTVRSVE